MSSDYKDKVILAIGAHPDDVEFSSGATMALMASQGARVIIVVATDGNRGSRHHQVEKSQLVSSRKQEQQDAAQVLGAQEVIFLDQEDGNLQANIEFKEKVVRLIRKYKPDMVFTHDPSWYYRIQDNGTASVNHTDHRATGEAVIDTVYPLARDRQSFPDHMVEGLDPHKVPELYLWSSLEPNFYFDVIEYVQTKIDSIAAHKSQIDDIEDISKKVTDRLQKNGQKGGSEYAEAFTQLRFD